MRVLITAGGTRQPVDEVRWIGNVSTGRFGAELARDFVSRGIEVVHLHARGAEMPFQRTIDFAEDWQHQLEGARQAAEQFEPLKKLYRSLVFTDVADYAGLLEQVLVREKIDIAFMTAAVSDFQPEPQRGKIASKDGEIMLRLGPVPKIISRVKKWSPRTYLVGFKLLVGVGKKELEQAALESAKANGADVTVANELRMLRQGNHTIHLVRAGQETETYPASEGPAHRLVERVLTWYEQSRQPRLSVT